MGGSAEPTTLHIVEKLASIYDVLGVVSYPWKNYETAKQLPDDYDSRLVSYASWPIGFTEIVWRSDRAQGGSKEEQLEYLLPYLELTRRMKLEFVN